MYNAYFGFREKPFKLVPNPEYLFLSRSHEDALAYLNYAISQGEGFVEITGEVGTGKTTLCRAFLESLDDTTAAAYIFNPKLNPKQLLRSINDEFGITCETDDTKDLIDALNRFLLQTKQERRKAILLIDEAQNLSETVLEQLRLLSNLETKKDKLLQIILVGQPELAAMLDSHDLRQIGQRISIRCRISPLSLRETQEYIQYRLNIASQKRLALFDRTAIRRIYAFSSGIPRMINIACDRALLTAFGMNRRKVTGRIAQAALAEITHRGRTPARGLMDGRKALALFVAICAVAASLVYHKPLGDRLKGIFGGRPAAAPSGPAGTEVATAIAAAPLPSAGAEAEPGTDQNTPAAPAPSARSRNTTGPAADGTRLAGLLKQLEGRSSRVTALKETIGAWGATVESRPYLESIDDDSTFFNLSAKAAGFFIQRVEAALELLLRLDMPAVLEFRSAPKGPSVYLVLSGETETGLVLKGTGAAPLVAAADDIQQHWSGVAYIPWKNFLSIEGTIPGSAPPDSVVALKMLLRELGHRNLPLSREFDSATQKTIEQIQALNGLPVDGVVGSLTKIVLYRDGKTFKVPRLTVK